MTPIGTTDDRSREASADGFQHRTFTALGEAANTRATGRPAPSRRQLQIMTEHTQSSTAADGRTNTHAVADDPPEGDGSVALLHVEPDAGSAELLAAFVERFAEGVAVRSVAGMEPALDAIDEIDCVVTEQRLPDGSGVELVERLRKRGIEAPVVFHTTCREDGTKARALEAGADAYFSKRSERGQYGRVLDRLHGLVDDARAARTTTVSPETPGSSAGASPSER